MTAAGPAAPAVIAGGRGTWQGGAVELRAQGTVAVVDLEHGGRLASLRLPPAGGGEPLELVGRYSDSPHGWGAFPMAPFAGRLKEAGLRWRGGSWTLPANKAPHAIHGTVARVPWQVVDEPQEGLADAVADAASPPAARAVLRADLGEHWPWPGHAVLRYTLSPHRLQTTLEVHADQAPMPAWCGIHPWFPRVLGGQRVRMDVRARAAMVAVDGIPDGTEEPVPAGPPQDADLDTVLDDVDWPITLTWPGVARLSVTADTAWGVVFTQREAAVCAEPQTAPPDAANLDLAGVAEPGAPVLMTMVWDFAALDG